MSDTNFANGTLVTAAWANDVNEATYSQVTSVANIRALISSRIRYAQTKGYTTAGDGGHGRYYLDAADTTSTDNGGTIIVGTDGGRWKLIHTGEVSVKQFGLGSNSSNDITGVQTMFQHARDDGFNIYFPKNTKCFVEFSVTTPYVFIDGKVNIRGEDRFSCGFRINVNYAMTGHAPLFMWGVPSKGGTVNKSQGTINGVGWWLTAGCQRFERANHVYGCNGLYVDNCYADFTQVTWPAADGGHPSGYQAGGWWSSNNQPTFAVGQTQDQNFWFTNNIGFASAEYQNAESVGFTNTLNVRYMNNYLVGWSDDMAVHECVDVVMQNNHYKAVSGRLFMGNSHNCKIINNFLQPIIGPISGVYLGSTRTFIHTDMTMRTALSPVLTEVANYEVLINGNSIYLPSGSYCSAAIQCYGVQDALTVTDNTVHNDGATSHARVLSVQTIHTAGWTGTVGNPDFGSGGNVRIRSCKIDGNKATGGGWSANEGDISISFDVGGSASDLVGPITVNENEAGAYYMPGDTIDFRDTNRTIPVSTDPYQNIHPSTIDRLVRSWSAVLIDGQNLNFAGHPTGSELHITDPYQLDFVASEAGSVRAVILTLTSGRHLDGAFASAIVKKNGSTLGSGAFIEIGTAPNSYRYQLSFFGTASMTFAKTDTISVFLGFSAGQTTKIEGRCDLLCLYN